MHSLPPKQAVPASPSSCEQLTADDVSSMQSAQLLSLPFLLNLE
jgi:hypothetical protein